MKVKTIKKAGKVGLQGAAVAGGIAFAGLIGGGIASADELPAGMPAEAQSFYDAAPVQVQDGIKNGFGFLQNAGLVQTPAPLAVQNAPVEQDSAAVSTKDSDAELARTGQSTQETGKAEDVSLADVSPDLEKFATSRSLPELVDKYVPGGGQWLQDSGTLNTINIALDGVIGGSNTVVVPDLPQNNVVNQGMRDQLRAFIAPSVCGIDVCADTLADFGTKAANDGIDDLIQLGSNPLGWAQRHIAMTQVGIGGAAQGTKDFVEDPALWTAEIFNKVFNPEAAFYDSLRGVGGEDLAYSVYAFVQKNLPQVVFSDGDEFNWPKGVLLAAALAPGALGLALAAGIIVLGAILSPIALIPGVLAGAAVGTAIWAALIPVLGPITTPIVFPVLITILGVGASILAIVAVLTVAAIVAAPFLILSAILTANLLRVTGNVPWFVDGTVVNILPPKGECPEEGAPTLINPTGAKSPLSPEQRILPKVNTWVKELFDIPGFFWRAMTDPNAPASVVPGGNLGNRA